MKKTIFLLLPLILLVSCTSEPSVPQISKNIESAVFGAPSSKVELTIFTDYECPACIFFDKTIGDELHEKYIATNKITATYKNFPLPQHKNSLRDSLAALCALSEGKYKEFSTEMYTLEDEKKGNKTTDAERIALAKKVGIDTVVFAQCLSEGWYTSKIESERAEGNALGIQGTPSVYLNGKIMKFKSKEEFFGIIEAVLK